MKKLVLKLLISAIAMTVSCALFAADTDKSAETAAAQPTPAFDEPAVKAEVEKFLRDNAKAMQDENLEASLATVAEKDKAQAKAIFEQIFKMFDLKYTLEKIEIVVKDANTAEATVVQKTEKVAGPEFRDNRGKFLHTLKKVDDKWTFADTKILSVDFLDNQ